MEKNFEFNVEKFVADLESLGVHVTRNAEEPGFFTECDGKVIEISEKEIFPEFIRLTNAFEPFHAEEKIERPAKVKVHIEQNGQSFTILDLMIGAA